MPPSGSSSRPGLPTWARPSADLLFGKQSKKTGVYGDAVAGQGAVNFNDLLAGMQPSLAAANAGGLMQRDLAAGLTQQGVMDAQNTLAGMNDSLGTQNWLNGQTQDMFGAAADFSGRINQGAAGINAGMENIQNSINRSDAGLRQQNYFLDQAQNMFGAANDFSTRVHQGAAGMQDALGGATTSMNNVMNPTMYNPLFQNYAKQLETPINAQFSARGLGSSGAPIAATTAAQTDLGSKFAERQFQEQMQAQQNVGNIGQNLGNLGVASAQLPGQVFNQFMGGINQGIQGNQMVGQMGMNQGQLGQGLGQLGVESAQVPGQVYNQFMGGIGQGINNRNVVGQAGLLPLQAMGLGSDQFWQGVNNPIATGANMYEISRDPMKTLMGGTIGAMGGITSPPSSGFLGKVMGK